MEGPRYRAKSTRMYAGRSLLFGEVCGQKMMSITVPMLPLKRPHSGHILVPVNATVAPTHIEVEAGVDSLS